MSKALEHFRREPFDALKDISFRIEPGQMVGFIGANGAGKSTVLRLIAGISEPTRGDVLVNGHVTALLELGVGFHPELSGMENIFYNGALLGLPKAQILGALPEIIAFSGLADFLDEPVKHYSSGMFSRLACSVALHLDPQIILVDEILSVGDAEFQNRARLRIMELHKAGVTILLVTHELKMARVICDQLIWIDGGRIRMAGAPAAVYNEYMKSCLLKGRPPFASPPNPPRAGIAVIAKNGIVVEGPVTDEPAEVSIPLENLQGPVRAELTIRWEDGLLLLRCPSVLVEPDALGRATVLFSVERWPFLLATQWVGLALFDSATDQELYDAPFLRAIHTTTPTLAFNDGIATPRVAWTLTPIAD